MLGGGYSAMDLGLLVVGARPSCEQVVGHVPRQAALIAPIRAGAPR